VFLDYISLKPLNFTSPIINELKQMGFTCCIHGHIKQVIALPTQFMELLAKILPADVTNQMARLLREGLEIMDDILKNLKPHEIIILTLMVFVLS